MDRMLAAEGRSAAVGRILKRTLLLYVLGLFYYGGLSVPITELRLLGVLQRLALCYGATSLIYVTFKPRTLLITAVGLLVGYWALLRFVPVPGFGAGDFAEGHNLTNWFDAQFLPFRKWDGDHDPEGILSTLPAIASCIGGALACLWLRSERKSPGARSAVLVAAGLLLVGFGFVWGLEFPVIKKLWTSSFVLVAGGWSCVLLGCFHYMVDVRHWRSWAVPFIWVGCNPLAIYLISNVMDFNALAARFAGGDVSKFLDSLWPGLGGLSVALIGAALCFGICGFLYKRKIFLRL
jgi:predicted acyltransferase